jgi:flavorubredoxin
MAVRKLKKDIYSVGGIDWDRRLFDELIPLPEGTTYNSYLINGGKKTALIDTVDPRTEEELIVNLNKLKIKKIDYLISNHAEQDHSGTIPVIIDLYPEAKVVTNEKCKNMLIDLLNIPDKKFKVIKDKEKLSLGNKTLEFIITPWVHWPETMVTYLKEDKILFSCDFFGSHYASSDLFIEKEEIELMNAKRYYAEIMMPFRSQIKRNLKKLEDYEINIIAPSHGAVYQNPELIINAYKKWTGDDVTNEVIIPYVSMHGSTKKMVDYLYNVLVERGIKTTPFNLLETDTGSLAISLVNTATVILATPTILTGPHPNAVYAAVLLNALRPKTKYISIIGSYGWRGKTIEVLKSLLSNLKVELIEPYLSKGYPNKKDFKALDELADEILKRHKKLNLI